MGDLLSILSSSATALNAEQSVAAVASNNLDNVDTPGYAVQTANLSSSPLDVLGGTVLGGGVAVGSVTQTRDRFIEAQLPGAQGAAAYSQAQSDSLTAVDALNALDQRRTLAVALGLLGGEAVALAGPGNSSLRTSAIASAQQVATAFNTTASSLTQAQDGLDSEISASVAQVNTLSAQMASLNQQIRVASSSGQPPNALLDQRQSVQDQLVALTGAQPVSDAQGDVSLALPGGDALVAGYAAATLTAGLFTNSGHVALSITSGDASAARPSRRFDGRPDWRLALGPRRRARHRGQLALLPRQRLRQRGQHRARRRLRHRRLDREQPLQRQRHRPGRGREPLGQQRHRQRSLDAGDRGQRHRGAGRRERPRHAAGGAGPGLALERTDRLRRSATITAQFGSSTEAATSNAAQDQASLTNLNTLRASASGVSSDQELVNMQKAQSAYEAISKAITTAQTMLDALMAIQAT